MPIPEQVQKQAEAAEKLQKELIGKTEEEEAGKEAPKDEDQPGEPKQDLAPDETDEPEAEEGKVVQLRDDKPKGEETWEHKYSVLKGKYDKEIKPLRDKANRLEADFNNLRISNEKLQAHNAELAVLLSDTQKRLSETKPESVTSLKDGDVLQYLSQEEIEELENADIGASALKAIAKIADGIANQKVSALMEHEVKSLKAEQAGIRREQAMTREDMFWEDIESTIPDWETINNNPDFHDYLRQKAPYVKATRGQILAQAQRELDANTVIEMFQEFKGLSAPAQPSPAPQASLAKEVVPARSAATSQAQAGSKKGKIWTVKEIGKFYKDCALGRYTKDKQTELEKDIFAAQTEGRIQR